MYNIMAIGEALVFSGFFRSDLSFWSANTGGILDIKGF